MEKERFIPNRQLPLASPVNSAELHKPKMGRREFIYKTGLVGAAVGYGLYKTNQEVTKIRWPLSGAAVRELEHDTEVPEDKKHAATFVFGGLGTRDSTAEAKALQGALQDMGRVVTVRYGSNKLDLPGVAEAMNTYIAENKITEINVYGDSMGGLAAVHTLPMIDRTLNDGVTINYIMEDCTPVTKDNVRAKHASPIEVLAKKGFHGGGFLGKGASQLVSQFDALSDYLDIKGQLELAWSTTIDNTDPALWMDQLKLVANSDVDQFAQCLSEINYNRVYYICPRNPKHDSVVDDEEAIRALIEANDKAKKTRREDKRLVSGANVHIIQIPGTSHASCVENPERYKHAIRSEIVLVEQSTSPSPIQMYRSDLVPGAKA